MSRGTPTKKLGRPSMSLRERAGQPCLRSFRHILFIYLFIHPFISRWRTLLSVDDLVEEVITTLDAGKLLNNTYVIFSSDNGFHLGKGYFIHILICISVSARIISFFNRVFSLTWPAYMQIYWNKRKRLHKKRVQLPQDWFGTPTWPPFHCFGAPIWPP